MEPGPLGQPGVDLEAIVDRAVVQNQMQVEAGRRLPVDEPQECKELPMPVALGASADRLAARHVQGAEQRRASVADVAFDIAQPHGLGPVGCLDLALLVDAKHERVVRRKSRRSAEAGALWPRRTGSTPS